MYVVDDDEINFAMDEMSYYYSDELIRYDYDSAYAYACMMMYV